jgi:hypothetical protein
MGLLFRLAELLILVLPLSGMIIAAYRAFTANRRRTGGSPDAARVVRPEDERGGPAVHAVGNQAAVWASIRRVVEEHRRTDERWLDYELDFAKVLDFPLMTDMRNQLTMDFHKAKLRAEFLRPAKAEDLLDDRRAADNYLAAVSDYVAAFTAAEAEAVRRRRGDLSQEDQQRLARAQSLLRVASDSAATHQERQQAYDRGRKELAGLIVLPPAAQAAIERGISGE